MLKSLIWWNLLEKREAFLYEKALKTDICAVRFALITNLTLFSFKIEIFSYTLPNLYKNAQIFTTVRLALTLLLELICFKIITERFALFK
jgi:hypothetical protein